MYIGTLDDIINEYNNTFHRTIKMNPVDINSTAYVDFDFENIGEDALFEVGDHMRISKLKNSFAKSYTPNWSEEYFFD